MITMSCCAGGRAWDGCCTHHVCADEKEDLNRGEQKRLVFVCGGGRGYGRVWGKGVWGCVWACGGWVGEKRVERGGLGERVKEGGEAAR